MNSIKFNKHYRELVVFCNTHFPKSVAKMRFKRMFGRPLNLRHPEDLNEKILWLSLCTDTSEWTRLADKYAVREYIKECGLEECLVPLLGKWDSVDEIQWNSLPNAFVLKSNNGSGTVMIVRDKDTLSIPEVKNKMDSWLHSTSGSTTSEFHYRRIIPCLVAEELLELTEEDKKYSSSIVDYKMWCFNGKVSYIWTVSNRDSKGFDGAMFDRDWNYVPDVVKDNPSVKIPKKLLPKPVNYERMIEVAETLAKPFPKVRVDLYNINGKVYFGEMTFTTHGGTIDYLTPEQLMKMGKMIDLSKEKAIR